MTVSPNAMKVYEALKTFGANSSEKIKSADQVMEKAKLGKGQINAALAELQKNKVVKRMARSKRAGYYIIKDI